MHIYEADKIRALDAYTIAHEPIASLDLMERASQAFVEAFEQEVGADRQVVVLAGPGNNGGDGLAIARLLIGRGYLVRVFVFNPKGRLSPDAAANLLRFGEAFANPLASPADLPDLRGRVVIDALFGSGLDRPLEGAAAALVTAVNESGVEVYAVDIASGLPCDGLLGGRAICPVMTISFQFPKLAFFFPEHEPYVGKLRVVDIGLSAEGQAQTPTPFAQFGLAEAGAIFRPRGRHDHKGSHGHGLLAGGSLGKIGAMVMGSAAAARSGIGLLTAHLPKRGYEIMQMAVPEAMATVDSEADWLSELPQDGRFSAVGIGPGMGQQRDTAFALGRFLRRNRAPLVLDADALNLLAKRPAWWAHLGQHTILTPHPGEFVRLAGESADSLTQLQKLRAFCREHGVITVLKGAHTAVADAQGSVSFNASGNPGMAKGGAGDVLTGVILALLAKGYAAWDAARLGVFVHGLAGDLAAAELGMEGMTAQDLVSWLPKAWRLVSEAAGRTV